MTIAIVICLIMIPAVNAAFIPIRYFMCQGVVTELVNKLAHCETRSGAYKILNQNDGLQKLLTACGAEAKHSSLVMMATASKAGNKTMVIEQASSIPDEWLPDGKLGGCVYSLHLDCDCAISPLFGGSGTVPGFNAPVTLKVSSSANWANLARDPKSSTLSFYMQE